MSIGSRIRAKREELGLTLEAVAEQLGVHRSTVLRYETGDTRHIPLDTVEKLAGILHTTPADLLGWQEPAEPELDPEIRLVARNMQRLPPEQRSALIRIIRTMSDIADEEMPKP